MIGDVIRAPALTGRRPSYILYVVANRSTRINARLDPALARKVEAVQRRTKKSLTHIVKESLELYCEARLQEGTSTYDALQAAGFIGCADGPADLSERYKEELSKSLARKS